MNMIGGRTITRIDQNSSYPLYRQSPSHWLRRVHDVKHPAHITLVATDYEKRLRDLVLGLERIGAIGES